MAMTLVMSFAFSSLQTANAQDKPDLTSQEAVDLSQQDEPVLTSQEALALLQQDVGKWTGTRTSLDGAEDSEVTIVNRIEADKWLYFQIAVKLDSETSLTKGTLEFDSESETFTRRWFDNGSADIKEAKVEFDAEAEEFRYSIIVPDSTLIADEGDLAFDVDDDFSEDVRVTIASRARSEDVRVVEVFVQDDLTVESEGELKSELVLTRVKPKKARAVKKKPIAKKTNSGSSTKASKSLAPKKTAEPVTHVLRVTVFVGSNRLQAGQKPDLTISPDDGVKMRRASGDTFEFTGLKPDEEYSVSGDYKLTTGFGVETKGETTPWKAPENQRKTTVTKMLRLE